MKTIWVNGKKTPFFSRKNGKVFGRYASGRRCWAEFALTTKGGRWFIPEDVESKRPEVDWKKETW